MNTNNYKRELFKHSPILIWGSGSAGKEILDFIRSERKESKVYFIDSNPDFWNKTRYGCYVIPPKDLLRFIDNNPNAKILIGSKANTQIKAELDKIGIESSRIDINALGIIRNFFVNNASEIIAQNKEIINQVYNLLADDKSKMIYKRIIQYRCTGDLSLLENLAEKEENQYFEPEFKRPHFHESYVDCGGYVGDTLSAFLNYTDNQYDAYYIFEPDEDSYHKMIEFVNRLESHNITAFMKGCWNVETKLRFNSSGTWSSHIDNNGKCEIETVMLDHVLSDKEITFIKMDIEGAEKEALQGCANLIRKNHPMLAISIYHKIQDLFLIPLYIWNLSHDYSLYIRVYSERSDTEIICYAL